MFKKRAVVANKVNLKQQLQDIVTLPSPPSETIEDNNKPKFSTTIQIQQSQNTTSNRIKGSSQYQIMQTLPAPPSNIPTAFPNYFSSPSYNPYNPSNQFQQISQQSKEPIVVMEVQQEVIEISDDEESPQLYKQVMIIQDDSGNEVEILPVIQDTRGRVDEEEDDFEDEIIKRALTKENYQKVNKHKKQEIVESKYKRMINRISKESIMGNITKEIKKSQERMKGLEERVEYHNQRASEIQRKLKGKQREYQETLQEFQQVQKVLKLIYYRASDIKEFTLSSLFVQVQQQSQYIL